MDVGNKNSNVGRRARLILRQLNGANSVFTGVISAESDLTWSIKTDRGEEQVHPKLYCTVEFLNR